MVPVQSSLGDGSTAVFSVSGFLHPFCLLCSNAPSDAETMMETSLWDWAPHKPLSSGFVSSCFHGGLHLL